MSVKSNNMEPIERAKFVLRNRDEREYTTAYDILLRNGSPEAQYYIGLMYARGQGVAKDYDVAVSWFMKAYNSGHLGAAFFLGKMHATGIGLTKDSTAAIRYFSECADTDVRAQFEIGLLYFNDDQIPRNLVESAKWMLRAAENGHTEAQFMIGQYYKNGAGVHKDIDKALGWLTAAAMNRHKGAQILLGNMYRTADGVPLDRNESDRWYDMADGKINPKNEPERSD